MMAWKTTSEQCLKHEWDPSWPPTVDDWPMFFAFSALTVLVLIPVRRWWKGRG